MVNGANVGSDSASNVGPDVLRMPMCGAAVQRKRAKCFKGAPAGQCYLRVEVALPDGSAPGAPLVMEIWPPGHFSPVHNHGGCFGVVRVLHGEVRSTLPSACLTCTPKSAVRSPLPA
jgi:hypothetical protein